MPDDREALLDLLSPFHVVLGHDWTIERVGPRLAARLAASPVGRSLGDVFRASRPQLEDATELRDRLGQIIVLDAVGTNLRLRGELVSLPDGAVAFVGTPWITSMEELSSSGLSLDQFAPHDPSGDYVLLLTAMREQAADLERVVRRLEEKDGKLRESEAEARRLSLVAARTTNAVIMTDPQGRIEWVNDGFRRLTGYTFDEVKGRTPGSVLQGPGTDRETVALMRAGVRSGEGFTTDILNYSKSGQPYWVHAEVQPIHDDSGALVQFMAVETDITRYVRLQRLFRLAESTTSSFLAEENLGRATIAFLSGLAELLMPDRIRLLPLRTDQSWLHEVRQARTNPVIDMPALDEAEQSALVSWVSQIGSSGIRITGASGEDDPPLPFPIADAARRGLMVVPVMTAAGCAALIVVETFDKDASWREEELSVLLAFAQGMARAIEHRGDARRLRVALNAAQVATREKTAFLANMSHEIRTPMMAIVGHAQLLSRRELKPHQREESSAQLRRSADHLLSLVNDVLDISKIESGAIVVEQTECDLALLLSDAVALIRPQAAEKGLALETNGTGRVPARVSTDALRLRQILVNLLSNAVKFTDEGRVGLSVQGDSNGSGSVRLRLRVEDTGQGIEPDSVETLFLPFTQANSQLKRARGTGLGLTISRSLARLLGGDIHVESTVGRGSIFTVEVEAEIWPRTEWIEASELFIPEPAPAGAADTVVSLSGTRVHVVDDNADNVCIIRFLLQEAGAVVTESSNGAEALEWLLQTEGTARQPDVVLMDMMMPVLDGYSATQRLREHGFTRPIIALTAFALATDREKCLRCGCDDYLTKPVDTATMLHLVQQHARECAAGAEPGR